MSDSLDYSWFNKLTDTPPQLAPATYRFRPSTGSVQIVEDTLLQPNGIAISPDASTVYISDTGAVSAKLEQNATQQEGATFDPLGKRTVYAFNISEDATYIFNKRPVYIAQDWVPDGLKTACNGYILTGAGKGVDVLDSTGQLLVRIQTNYTVQNFAWTGSELKTLWIMGNDGISKVEWNLQGVDLTQ